jgi:quercetin dioxygenase-like cupin family protein
MAFIHLPDLEEKQVIPGFHARMQHTEHMTVAFWNVEAGASLPEHHHPHEQITAVIRGTFEMTVDGEKRIIEPGDVAIIPSQATHSAQALTDCYLMDVFSPVREDYR